MDDKLIIRCIQQDQSAFEIVYNNYAGYVYTLCRRYAIPENDIKDTIQDVFSEVFFSIKKYDNNKAQFTTWLRAISVNIILKALRKNKLKPSETLHIDQAFDQGFLQVCNLDKDLILNEISCLPQDYRIVFNMAVLEGFSHKEIAKKLGITDGSSRSRLSRAKQMLRRKLLFIMPKEMKYGI